jgi:very-short-patch-repair endonuclease
MLPYSPRLKRPARRLRSNMTDAEQLLWSRLRREQILDIQFYRQKPLGPYIVDFYAPKARLVVEVDGSQHFEPAATRYDRGRSAQLAELGVRILRFDNLQVLHELEAVVEQIWVAVQAAANPP